MIQLEEVLATEEGPRKPARIPFYQELTATIGKIEKMKTDAEKHAGYCLAAEMCEILSHDGVREEMGKIAKAFEQEAKKYETN